MDWIGSQRRRASGGQTNRVSLLKIASILEVGSAARDIDVHELTIRHAKGSARVNAFILRAERLEQNRGCKREPLDRHK